MFFKESISLQIMWFIISHATMPQSLLNFCDTVILHLDKKVRPLRSKIAFVKTSNKELKIFSLRGSKRMTFCKKNTVE